MTTPVNPFQLLAAKLQQCPTQDETCSPQRLREVWSRFQQLAPGEGDEVTPAVLVGLILYDESVFAALLNEAERAQLVAVGQAALERYHDKTHPLNKVGKTMAAAIKESI